MTQPDQPAGRGNQLREPPIKTLARELGLPVLQPERVRRPEPVEELRALAAEAFVVFAYGQILPQTVLDLPQLASLNIHASLLPRWRGAAPIQAAIRAGDELTGHTVMYMDAGLDTGDILLQREIVIGAAETGGQLHDRLAALAPECILTALEQLSAGHAPRIPQDAAHVTLAPKLEREHGRIDWRQPAAVLARTIRAFDPWPGTFTTFAEGRKLKIYSAAPLDAAGPAGSVLFLDHRGLVIACGEGSLALREVQLEGRKRVSARDFINGGGLKLGDQLGMPDEAGSL